MAIQAIFNKNTNFTRRIRSNLIDMIRTVIININNIDSSSPFFNDDGHNENPSILLC